LQLSPDYSPEVGFSLLIAYDEDAFYLHRSDSERRP
jgi:hypothetical protein